MADVVVKLKVMPAGVEADLKVLAGKVEEAIKKSGGNQITYVEEPVAFGLKALIFTFLRDEKKGGTEPLEKELESVKEIQSAEVIDVRRAFG